MVQFPQLHRWRASAEEMRPGGRDVPDCSREVAKEQHTARFETAITFVCSLQMFFFFFNQGQLTGIFYGNRLAEGIDASCELHSWLELPDGGLDGPAQSC